MSIAYVAERASQVSASAATATEAVTLSSNCTPKSCLVLHNAVGLNLAITSITDTKSNTWTVTSGGTANTAVVAVTMQDGGALTTSDTVTITYGSNATSSRLTLIEEFSGVNGSASDGSSTLATAAGTTANAGTATPSVISDMSVVTFAVSSTGACTRNATGTVGTYSGYTTSSLTGTALQLFPCCNTACTTAAQECAITTPVANTEGAMVLLKAATQISSSDTGSGIDGISNLVPNPGFETDTSSWSTGASFWSNTGATLTRITTDFDTGTACGQVVTDASLNQEGIWVNTLPVLAANTSYTFVARVKWISGRPIRMGFRDASNAASVQTAYSSPAQWTTFKLTYTTGSVAPATTSRLAIVTDTTAAASTFYVDSVFCYLTSELETVNLSDATPETGTGTESSTMGISSSDTGSGVEAGSVSASLTGSDTGTGADSPPNLVPNPGFEVDTSSWAAGSSFWTNTGATLTRITSDFDSGVACGQVVTNSSLNQEGITCSTLPTLSANTSYTVTARVKWISGRSVRLAFRDATNAKVAQTAYSSPAQWTTFSVTIVTGASPVTSSVLAVATDLTAGASTFYVDTVSVFATSLATEQLNVSVATPETGTGTDSAVVGIADSDAASGLDGGEGIDVVAADTGSGSEAASPPSATLLATDTAAALDAGNVNASMVTSGDTGSAVEAGGPRVPVSDADTASGTETSSVFVRASYMVISLANAQDRWVR